MSGIIPTRVGTSVNPPYHICINMDHPHACGDKVKIAFPDSNILGSSPRVWGQAFTDSFSSAMERIIPTRVGTSALKHSSSVLYVDHPHACGDKEILPCPVRCCAGSSPRVWGQDEWVFSERDRRRIIPTRVGTSAEECEICGSWWDHPHACGDKTIVNFPSTVT